MPDPTLALSVPGQLVVMSPGPFTPSGALPYGGTQLGVVRAAKVVREGAYAWRHSEARGRDKVRGYRGRETASFAFVIVQRDPDLVNNCWAVNTISPGPNGYAGPNTLMLPQPGRTLQPGVITPGSPLLFAADNPAHPSVMIWSPIWTPGARLELDLVLDKPLEEAVVVVAGLDSSNNDIQIDSIEQLLSSGGGGGGGGGMGSWIVHSVISAGRTLDGSAVVWPCSTIAGGYSVVLPSATGQNGLVYVVLKSSSDGNTLVIAAQAGQTIDGSASQSIVVPWQALSFVSDGTNWIEF